MPPQENNSKLKNWFVTKIVLIISGIVIVLIGLFFAFQSQFFVLPIFIIKALVGYNDLTHSFSSCGYAYTELPLPDYLKGSEIIFDKPVYGIKNLDLGSSCISIFKQFGNGINRIEPYTSSSFSTSEIPNGTVFTVDKRVYVSCGSMSCMDAGGGGDMIILKDDKGTLWEIDPDHFNPKSWSSERFLFKAGYYKNNERLGDVILENVSPTSYSNKEIKDKWIN